MINVKLTPSLPFDVYSNQSLYNFTKKYVDSATTEEVALMTVEGVHAFENGSCDPVRITLHILFLPIICLMFMVDQEATKQCFSKPTPFQYTKKRMKQENMHSNLKFVEA